MNLRVILFALTMAGFSTLAKGQDLNTYQWNHRLVLLLTADSNQAQFQEQLALFDKDKDGLFRLPRVTVDRVAKPGERTLSYIKNITEREISSLSSSD